MTEKVSAQLKDGAAAIEFEYDFGDSLSDAVTKFGEDVLWAYAKRSLVIASQGYVRGLMKSGKSKEEILAAIAAWKPGEPRQVKSKEERIRALLDKMSPEDRARLREELKAEVAGTKKGKAA